MNSSKDVTILVIEKDEDLKEDICNKLISHNFKNILCAKSIKEVIEFIENNELPDIVLLGEISDMNILEATKIIRESTNTSVLILLAKSTSITTPLEALQLGCEAWIEKDDPQSMDNILNKVYHWSQYKLAFNKLQNLYVDRRLESGR